ncbi:MAG: DUF116 domain-containing protein [Firmicutes bacterium]|nr:DUF116 domain-containing protein [Bacillota bacterium]
MKGNEKKRVFMGLIIISLLVMAAIAGLIWYLFRTESQVGRWLWFVAILLLSGFLIYAAAGIFSLLVSLITGQNISVLSKARQRAAFAFLPIALRLGGLLGIDQDRIRASFIEVNNQLIRQRQRRVNPEELLILAPVCLQQAECPRKVTSDIWQCRRCGRCSVGGLLELAERYGVHAAIATGGTKARQLLRDLRPQVVVAIACERDLVSGLQDSRRITVRGITNQRPHGPCFNTQVDLEKVEAALRSCLLPGNNRQHVNAMSDQGSMQDSGKLE